VIVRGKIEERAEEPGILLDEVWTVEEALARFEGGVVVHLGPEDGGALHALRGILSRHAGPRPVFLEVRGIDGTVRRVRAGSDCRVRVSAALAEQVDALLGRGRLRLARM